MHDHPPRAPLPLTAGPTGPGGAGIPSDGEPPSLLDELTPIEFEALRWSVRVSDGLSADAQAEFQAWLGADPAHCVAYEDVAEVWRAVDGIPPGGRARLRATVAIETAAESSARDLAATRHEAPAQVPAGPAASPAGARAPRRAFAQTLVAVLALGVLGGGGWLGWQQWQNQPVFSRDYATGRGQNLDVALPDGSHLLLDTASRASVSLYRGRREVRLPEGQAVFQVQADKARPFDVLAGAARITVVGTKFSVRYTPSLGEQSVQVAVIEGRVRVAAGAGAPVDLVPGQAVAVEADGRLGAIEPVVAEAIAPWQGRRLSFDGVPLARVLAEIGRYGDIGVHAPEAAVGQLPVTASVDLRHLAAFVQALPKVLPVRVVPREGGGTDIVGR